MTVIPDWKPRNASESSSKRSNSCRKMESCGWTSMASLQPLSTSQANTPLEGNGGASNAGCGDWICSRTYEVGAEKSRLKLVASQLRLSTTVAIA